MRLVEPVLKPRVWGSRDLRAWYPDAAARTEPIGEAWLSPENCPVLVKLLFPRERLSVQVHPDDAYAAAHGLGRGKSEAWYVVSAEPGAQVGVGLRAGVSFTDLEAACRAGRGAGMLHWFEVHAGEVITVPAGTVHAIGGGSVLLEVQQPSDTTFRLDDYGRGRELHLEPGMEVARQTDGGRCAAATSGLLLHTPFFQLWRWEGPVRIGAADEARWLVNLTSGGTIPRGWLAELAAGESFEQAEAATIMEVRAGQEWG
ncbi:MAG: mannose-6-phosphate isomerase [Acidobacteria bacterium]|nr:MAG: mannose-6-phosphate isomerase [Acidobacteriota bacterium]